MIQKVIEAGQFIVANLGTIAIALSGLILAAIGLVNALIAFFAIIPGEQPEKALKGVAAFFQKLADFVSKFSKKAAPKVDNGQAN